MPAYAVECPEHGLEEVVRPISEARLPFSCPVDGCGAPAEQRFLAAYVHSARIDDMESVGRERTGADRDVNLGLPGRFVENGKHPNGKPRMDYVPTTSAEASSNAKAREIARSNGLTPADSGRWRTTPR